MRINRFFSFCFVLALSGCKLVILDPKGAIAAAEKSILLDAVALMLLVVVPVIVMSALFAWRYRAKNQRATYTPSWAQSHLLEAICWGIPCVIIIILAILTWISTHKLDPYRPLQHAKKPLVIQAVALNWKWLFIYPEQHIATVNLVQFPVDRPVEFLVTADAPMNSFAIPQLAGQIYAMSGMRTRLHLIANAVGDYRGLSTNYSGEGFSGMTFIAKARSQASFDRWVTTVQHSPQRLTLTRYNQLVKPSKYEAVLYFSKPRQHLFNEIIMKYMHPGVKPMGMQD